MHRTKVFKNGVSLAVRIPADPAYERSDIERVGDGIRIRPARRALTGVLKKFSKFGPDFMSDGRESRDN